MRMRTIIATVVVAFGGALVGTGCSEHSRERNAQNSPAPSQSAVTDSSRADEQLAERLRTIASSAGGAVGVTVTHIESGRTVNIQHSSPLPLYSVFKLPLAIAVLKDVEENKLRIDRKVLTIPAEVVPGAQENTNLWRKPVERTVAELLELSVTRSDNTSTDKLLELVGGPMAVQQRMRSLGFQNFDIRSSVRNYIVDRTRVNTGTTADLGRLLVDLYQGHLLKPPQLPMLLGFMEHASTGQRRLRGLLPPGTLVADKTGTGGDGKATNDVGLVTLPKGKGHLAIAVLISESKLPLEEQEKIIAEVARASYDAHLSQTGSATQ